MHPEVAIRPEIKGVKQLDDGIGLSQTPRSAQSLEQPEVVGFTRVFDVRACGTIVQLHGLGFADLLQ